MDDQQIPRANFGAPPKVSGFAKIKGMFTAVVSVGALASGAVYLGTVLLPDGYRPGDVAGKLAGGTLTWETNTSVEATTNKIRREADAAAQPQAKAQIDVAMATAVINERTQALAPLDSLATGLDVACAGANRLSQVAGREWQGILGTVAQVTCGTGDQVRGFVVTSTIEAGTTAAAARGMPLRDASVVAPPNPFPPPAPQTVAFPPPRAVPLPATPPQAGRATVTPVQAVTPVKVKPTPMEFMQAMTLRQASQHYTREQVKLAEAVVALLPPEIRAHIRDGLAPGDDDVFAERVTALMKLAERMQ